MECGLLLERSYSSPIWGALWVLPLWVLSFSCLEHMDQMPAHRIQGIRQDQRQPFSFLLWNKAGLFACLGKSVAKYLQGDHKVVPHENLWWTPSAKRLPRRWWGSCLREVPWNVSEGQLMVMVSLALAPFSWWPWAATSWEEFGTRAKKQHSKSSGCKQNPRKAEWLITLERHPQAIISSKP